MDRLISLPFDFFFFLININRVTYDIKRQVSHIFGLDLTDLNLLFNTIDYC